MLFWLMGEIATNVHVFLELGDVGETKVFEVLIPSNY